MNGATVLVVDDNPLTCKMVRIALEAAGAHVVEAYGAREALAAAEAAHPDLILQDLVLGGREGLDLVADLRALPGMAATPILGMTGFLTAIEDPRAVRFDDILLKPIEPSRLVPIVTSYLRPRLQGDNIGRGRRILVVDDDPVQRRLARALLQQHGFRVELTAEGSEALAHAARERPDAILSDVIMPGMDGFSLALVVAADPALAGTPVVLLSSHVEPSDHDLAIDTGARAICRRTPNLAEAVAALVEALEVPPHEAPAAPVPATREERRERRVRDQLARQIQFSQELSERSELLATTLRVVATLSDSLARRQDLDGALEEVTYTLTDLSGASRGAIVLREEDASDRLAATFGFADSERGMLAVRVLRSDAYLRVIATAAPVTLRLDHDTGAERELLESIDAEALEITPLVARGQVLGALLLGSNLKAPLLQEGWLAVVRTIGAQIGHAISLNRTLAHARRAEQRARTLMEYANDGIAVLASDGVVLEANEQCETILGATRQMLIGRPARDFVADDALDAVIRLEAQLAADGACRGYSIPIRRGDGGAGVVDVSARVVEIGGERLTFAVLREVSERLRLEEQLRHAAKMEAIGQLTGGVAHDFNNLLTAILGFAELLASSLPSGDPRRQDVEEIRAAGQSAAHLTRQLLAFSRQQVLRPVDFALDEAVAKADRLLRRVIGEHVRLQTIAHQGVSIYADPGSIEQVLVNLAVNARDAMADGGDLTIEVSVVDLTQPVAAATGGIPPGRYARVSVRDTGCGMTADVKKHLFEPFFTTKPIGKGTGLGLATVYGIVRQAGGHIVVESAPGEGAAFHVYFTPVGAATLPAVPAEEAPDERWKGSETVLLVEDDGAVRRFTRSALERYGYTVVDAASPEEAIRLMQGYSGAVDVLVSDVVMPGQTGPVLADRLRAVYPALKVIYMSGYSGAALDGRLPRETPFVQKPFSTGEIVRRIREALSGPGPARE